jgi:hypothetical protein
LKGSNGKREHESSTSDNIYSEPNDEEIELKCEERNLEQIDFGMSSMSTKPVLNDVVYIENISNQPAEFNESLGKSKSDVLFSATKKAEVHYSS